MARPTGTFDAARYFRGDHGLRFYNVGTPRMRALAREIHGANRARWSIDDALTLADALVRDPYLETKSVGIELVARYRRSFAPRHLAIWKRWLSNNFSANWATTDAISGYLIGPLLAGHPELIPRLVPWSRDRTMWVRRASAVGLIVPMRTGLALDAAYDVAQALHGDREDLIQKAAGWMLREAGRRDDRRLERYLRTHGQSIPRTTVRYAIERLPAEKRRALLEATKPARDVQQRTTKTKRISTRSNEGNGG
jgi:3-methyladenine DNA glycosylase AlkD